MLEKIKTLKPPGGLGRLFLRSPILLYRLGLGWLLGNRLLLLIHTGRKTALQRQTTLEVIHYDSATDTYIVAAGFGKQSDWYRNLKTNPIASIKVGRRSLAVRARFVSPEEGEEIILEFAQRHPSEARMVKLLGYRVDGTEEDWRALGREIPLVALRPG